MIYQGRNKYAVREAIIHCSATPKSWANGKSIDQMVSDIRGWHKERGWRDIGYHRIIAPNGDVGVGRSLWDIGAHVRGRNRGTVGICLIGPGEPVGKFEDHFTVAQKIALKSYLKELRKLTDLIKVSGHNDYAAKACPGFKVETAEWL
ncbi:MAG: N-acetylmuramoyl-L-alanine amidase [Pseudoruegeria sp.]